MLRHLIAIFVSVVAFFAQSLFGQTSVSPENSHVRVIAVVPLIGTGDREDPIRPMFVPSPAEMRKTSQDLVAVARKVEESNTPAAKGTPPPPPVSAILGHHYQLSTDGKSALVEFVGSDRQALVAILGSKEPRVKAFERGKDKKDDIERELKKFKADFDLDAFVGGRQK